MLLSGATDVRVGTTPAKAVYLGTELIWPSVFSPKHIPGLLVWLDATAIAGKADNDILSSWPDSSGNALSAATGSGNPVFHTAGINGLPSVNFGQSGFSSMVVNPPHWVQDRTIFQVIQTLGSPFGIYHTTQLQELDPYMQTYGTPAGPINTYTNPVLSSPVGWSGAPQLISLWCEASTASQGLRVDGNEVGSSWSPVASPSPWHVGGFQPAGYAMNGYIGEMLFYERCLSPSERASVEAYLIEKWIGSPGPVYDPDTQAYLVATGLDASYAPILDDLVLDLKANGLWAKMTAIYPFIGGTAALHKWNLKDPRDLDAAYRLTFLGPNGGAHSTALGYRPNPQGLAANGNFADTHFVPLGTLAQDSTHLAFYSLQDVPPGDRAEMGNFAWGPANARFHIIARYQGVNAYYYGMSEAGATNTPIPAASGLFVATRTGPTVQTAYRNGVKVGGPDGNPSVALPNGSVYIGAINEFLNRSDIPVGFASIGSGLDDRNNTDLYNIVQAYQTALSRQV